MVDNQQQTNPQANQMSPMPNWNMPTMPSGMMPNPWMYYWMWQMQQGNGGNNLLAGPQMGNGRPLDNSTSSNDQNTVQGQDAKKAQSNRATIQCGIVETQKDIRPVDIPMDDGFGMFMRKDLEEIYIKHWADDGTIKTRRYIPVVEPSSDLDVNSSTAEFLQQANARFETLEKAIASVTKTLSELKKNGSSSDQKKLKKTEGDVDE